MPVRRSRPYAFPAALFPIVVALAPLRGASQEATTAPADTVVLRLAADGTRARYRVREQLAGFELPNDAVGESSAVTGRMVLAEDGSVDASRSRFVLDVATLKSDQDRRDNYLRRRTLEVEAHPTVVLVPTGLSGVTSPLPKEGTAPFRLEADLTVKGVTRRTVWEGEATFGPEGVEGSAVTRFTFDDFELAKPRLARLLSVADTIALELDFRLVRETATQR